MEMQKIYILVGLPGSGKSTWIKNNNTDWVIVSTDDIIEGIAKEKGLTYSDVWESNIKFATKKADSIFQEAIKDNRTIVWDQTNMTSKKRKSILNRIPKGYKKICVVFETPMHIIEQRLINREKETGKHIPKFVLINMNKSYEKPNLSEGFDEVIII